MDLFSSISKPDNIIPNLYLSGVDIAKQKKVLQKHDIKSILVIGIELEAYFPEVNYNLIK
jgi:hypothetical protein